MPLTEKELLLMAFDEAWSHRWESFAVATRDLTEEEALFQHPVYAQEKSEEGGPGPGSVLWHLVHLEYWHRYYHACLDCFPEAPAGMPEARAAASLEAAMQQLLATRDALRQRLGALPDGAFEAPFTTGTTMSQFVRMMLRHDTWHAAQIAMARRLWRGSLS